MDAIATALVPVVGAFLVGFVYESRVLLKLDVAATPDVRLRSIDAIVEL